MKIRDVSKKQASTIILRRWPMGLFIVKDDEMYVGIISSTGDVWTEGFKHRRSAVYRLFRE